MDVIVRYLIYYEGLLDVPAHALRALAATATDAFAQGSGLR